MRKIGRFPKMMVLQYERAKALGYNENNAKAIGYAQALKYAIFKNTSRIRIPTHKFQSKSSKAQNFEVHPIFKLYMIAGMPYVGGKIVKPEKFDFELNKRFVPGLGEVLKNWAKEIISHTPKEILENEQKFFKNVWIKVRDDQPLTNQNHRL